MSWEFGEGALRMNKATNFLIKAAHRAQKIWGLSDKAIIQCLERARQAEDHQSLFNNIDSDRAIKPVKPKAPQ